MRPLASLMSVIRRVDRGQCRSADATVTITYRRCASASAGVARHAERGRSSPRRRATAQAARSDACGDLLALQHAARRSRSAAIVPTSPGRTPRFSSASRSSTSRSRRSCGSDVFGWTTPASPGRTAAMRSSRVEPAVHVVHAHETGSARLESARQHRAHAAPAPSASRRRARRPPDRRRSRRLRRDAPARACAARLPGTKSSVAQHRPHLRSLRVSAA